MAKILTRLTIAMVIAFISVYTGSFAKNFMWEARGDSSVIYILGSVHLATSEIYPLDTAIENAFNRSDYLVTEVSMKDLKPELLLAKVIIKDSSTLANRLPKAIYDTLAAEFEKMSIPEMVYNKFKPWFAVMFYCQITSLDEGYSSEYGIDIHFMKEAAENKKQLELESADEQIDMLDSLFSDGIDYENFINTETEGYGAKLDTLLAAWKTGDTSAISALISQETGDDPMSKYINEKLINQRNIKMANKIEGWLRSGGKYFVIAGAAHLVGKQGIISLLEEKKRYKIIQK